MATHRAPECGLAERALIASLRRAGVALDARGYCLAAEDNLIEAVPPDLWRAAKADLEGGRGDELGGKFRAAYSSSALVVNTFVPMLTGVDIPSVGFIAGTPRLEQERSGGPGGFKPTLDVVLEGGDIDLFVESKCREYLAAGEAAFSIAWPRQAAERLSAAAARIYGDLYAGVQSYDPVDAPQLLKDLLAADKAARDRRRHVVLLYAYWEPNDADRHAIFKKHRAQAEALLAPLSSDRVTALRLSYQELWAHWEKKGQRHIEQLRQRYGVALVSDAPEFAARPG